jgi:phage-related baseplate assembly protein
MALSLQNFTTLVQNAAAAAQGAASTLLDMTTGSIVRAILQANASCALWMQWLLVLLMNRQRLATSTGVDVDSFVNDYFLTRLPAVAAQGNVTFSRYTNTYAAVIPVGATVLTADRTQTFSVIANSANSLWNGTGYTIPGGTTSGTVPVVALTLGSAGNVQAGAVTLLGTAVSGVDTVVNALAFSGGYNAESDASLKTRFQLYIQGLSKATQAAIGSAILSVQQGLTYNIAVNVNAASVYTPGNFVVTIDDGSGAPPAATITAVYNAVNLVRSICETFSVQGPTDVNVTISLTIVTAPGVIHANMIGPVASAITQYVNTLPVGAPLPYSMISNIAYTTGAGQITNVIGVTINGGTADIVPTAAQVIKIATVTVT